MSQNKNNQYNGGNTQNDYIKHDGITGGDRPQSNFTFISKDTSVSYDNGISKGGSATKESK